ncbi:MAG: phosphoribosyltransferase [Paraburkholderia sp.]|uniref:phosphoribosyltransferase n=1 Tax=Paraburkholderia sp. TaxID=1926495 RepID=UPI001203661C|nr:phosphoribosyltransferase family protein [Paraburkholderia sp.]TAL94168.1 MAG: phosphoribosyltransferase [Paraburkholderia sp.]
MEHRFADRAEAGRVLARQLGAYAGRGDVVVLGLPRGGVPVAFEVATALGVPLDVLVVRKLGLPMQPELAMGAIASGGALYVDRQLRDETGVTEAEFARVHMQERVELARREALYRDTRPALPVAGRTVIVVDDGMATGATLKVAVAALRANAPAAIVAALPVAPADAAHRLADSVDALVCAMKPHVFFSVGQFYADFSETDDDEVRDLLARSRRDASGNA